MLASKVYKSFVLDWATLQVKLKSNQFGGAKGCSTSHLLISVWQQILADLEDCRAATLLAAIDYSKAFNRMQFQECLKSFARHGASTKLIGIIATFLSGRTMSVRVGNSWSVKRRVNGGVPQGSILGVLLFNMTTDNLEDRENATDVGQAATEPCPPVQNDWLRTSADNYDPSGGGSGWMASTPSKDTLPDLTTNITPLRRGSSQFVFLDKARNAQRALGNDPDLTVLRDQTIPIEENPPTSAVWRPRDAGFHKYVDDGIAHSKLDMENVQMTTDGSRIKRKHVVASQNLFRRVVHNAVSIGMQVNSSKTNQVCISDALTFKADAYIRTGEGETVGTTDEMKLLGFYFSNRPNCSRHVEAICKSFRGK